jgi:hypothetical protein
VPETLDKEIRETYPVLDYKDLLEIISALPLKKQNCYHCLILQYAAFLDRTLSAFDLVRRFVWGELGTEAFLQMLPDTVGDADFSDNDVRTFNYFYYHNFAEFLRQRAPDLCFGDLGYQDAKKQGRNTRWLYEKNMQGPPFMEALLYNPTAPNSCWAMRDALAAQYQREEFQIAPRLEISLDLFRLAQAQDPDFEIGTLMLGTWSDGLKKMLREIEPYATVLRRRGTRNFHWDTVPLFALPFSRLAERLRVMFELLYDRRV